MIYDLRFTIYEGRARDGAILAILTTLPNLPSLPNLPNLPPD